MSCCCSFFRPKRSPASSPSQLIPQKNYAKHELLLTISGSKVHFIEEKDALLLSTGDFELIRVSDQSFPIAIIIKVGNEIQWPLTKDEPVVKIDAFHYLFSLPMKDGNSISYGVTFTEQNVDTLRLLDSFLKHHALLTIWASSFKKKDISWKEFAPRVDDYNNVLAKAIAGGTGHFVKGMFICSNAYAHQVQSGGGRILIQQADGEHCLLAAESGRTKNYNPTKKSAVNKSLKRVRKLSEITEQMSKTTLDAVEIASGSLMAPVVRSETGRAFLTMVTGEVLLVYHLLFDQKPDGTCCSLDAVYKIIDAAEVAERHALSATSDIVTRMVTKRFGENAGEATEDAMATAGHCFGTTWNVYQIQKTINPASTLSSGILMNASSKSIK